MLSTPTPIRRSLKSGGFSLLEVLACTAILVVAALAISPAVLGAHRNWQNVKDSAMLDLIENARPARITFQHIARRAIQGDVTIPSNTREITLGYFNSLGSTYADRYAKLSYGNGCLSLSTGSFDSSDKDKRKENELSNMVACRNVSNCVFTRRGNCVRMQLTLAENGRQVTMLTTAVMNN